MTVDDTLKELYVDNEQYDGYVRDSNVFGDDIAIEDDMSVLVRYQNDVIMTYHLTAYSPWEGQFTPHHHHFKREALLNPRSIRVPCHVQRKPRATRARSRGVYPQLT